MRVSSIKINDKILQSIVDSDIKIDEERISKIKKQTCKISIHYNGIQSFMTKLSFRQVVT